MSVLGLHVKISVPSTSDCTDADGKPYKVYNVVLKGPNGFEKSCQKRFNEFREFDKSWRTVYAGLHETYRLPTAKVYKNIGKSEEDLLTERRVGLEAYLNGLGSVSALQPLVCQFLEAPMSIFDQDKIKSRAAGPAPAAIAATSSVHETKHGNNSDAAKRAQMDKEAFLRQNAALIEQLMPGNHLVLEKQSASFSQGLVKNLKSKAAAIKGEAESGSSPSTKPTCMMTSDYNPQTGENEVLHVKKGEIVTIITEDDEHWWYGQNAAGEQGYFPAAIAEKIITFASPRSKLMLGQCCLSYTPDAEEEGVLTLVAGARITVLNQENENWWLGRLEDGREGFFPPQCFKADGSAELEAVVEPADLKEAVKSACKGIACRKYAFSINGFPKLADVFFRPLADSTTDLGCIFYADAGQRDTNHKRCIAVNSILEIRLGKQTEAFQRAVAHDAEVTRCFSIVFVSAGQTRSLDLEVLEVGRRGPFIGTLVAAAKAAKSTKLIVVKEEADLSAFDMTRPAAGSVTDGNQSKLEKAQAAYRWARKKTSTLADTAYFKAKTLKDGY
jgi:hypothetical protein